MECPKCKTECQEGDAECHKCGIIFEKYYQRQIKQEQPPPLTEAGNRLLGKCSACGNDISLQAANCPNCGNPQHAFPPGVKGWSWGACLLNWIWAIGNNTWIGLITLIPGVGFIMAIVLGFKGREWAWKNKHWDSLEHFNRVQKNWTIVGVIVVGCLIGFPLFLGVFFGMVSPQYQAYHQRVKQIETRSSKTAEEPKQSVAVAYSESLLPYQNTWESERSAALERCARITKDYHLQSVCLDSEKEGFSEMQGNFGFSQDEARKAKLRCAKITDEFHLQAVCMENEKEGFDKINGR
jgi:hypothetical protein